KHVWQNTSAKPTFNSEIESTNNEVENEIMANLEKLLQYICYTSYKIDWSNIKIVKAAANTINFLTLTDDGKVKCIYQIDIKEKITCMSCGLKNYKCTNAFDICDSMIAHSPMFVACEFINEEFHILNDFETAFNDQSTSDLTIVIKKQTIYVYKYILKIRSIYFENMFRANCIESKQRINLLSFEDLLDLLQMADEVCLKNLQIHCTGTIKKTITISKVIHFFNLINKMEEHYRKELMKYCFNFYFKNMMKVIRTEGFQQVDAATKAIFIDKERDFFFIKN
ncbi:RCBT1 protein, partial [Acromyrmex heyeri]